MIVICWQHHVEFDWATLNHHTTDWANFNPQLYHSLNHSIHQKSLIHNHSQTTWLKIQIEYESFPNKIFYSGLKDK